MPPDRLLCYLAFPDLRSLSVVSSTCNVHVRAFHLCAFRPDNILHSFFALSDIPSFMDLLSFTGCIVSGSVASKFFSRKCYDSNLDLFCSLSCCGSVGTWLLAHSFIFCRTDTQDDFFTVAFACVVTASLSVSPASSTFSDYDSTDIVHAWYFSAPDGTRPVQLMATLHLPVCAVLSFHSTCVLNFFNHRSAYSLYPHLTFVDGVNLPLCADGPPSPSVSATFLKWSNRGFPVISHPPLDRVLSAYSDMPLSSTRWVGNHHCWVVTFSVAPGVSHLSDEVRLNSWMIHYGKERANLLHPPFFSIVIPNSDPSSVFCVSPVESSSLGSILSHFSTALLRPSTLLSCLRDFRIPGHTSES
ncbi:hypothetical protein GYMLUDRAFT_241859 [Collybiopsis luxurians FD-317 M1]|uniref:Unplaced genomic scaffold GYMLUscaffold_16, whole genome shotgun sequence n=1 Tax=Collybiopsis luxurians FD-317 M1 TaxID=944289 RepID=A0A0D0CUV0_9AGAR|nr:hypothetical protein GYMLUDRAFT_241859 [Collybiopsis luxurians FD-317 M1]